MTPEREEWVRALRTILDDVAVLARILGIAEGAVGISDAVHGGAATDAEQRMTRLERTVRNANELAARLGETPLIVPGEKPVVDLRPWWSRVLEKVSATARRNTAAQQLETLRLEADAALLRSMSR
ncbi:MAG TPA: hypothetical protein VIV40_08655 [Kofleriaceae bacterium]